MNERPYKLLSEFPPALVEKAHAKYREVRSSYERRKARDYREMDRVYAKEAAMLENEEEWVDWWLNLPGQKREPGLVTLERSRNGRP